jgi:hypothetical protein
MSYLENLNNRQRRTLEAIFENPVRVNINWRDIVSLLRALGANVNEGRAGSRVGIVLNGVPSIIHKPHPRNEASMLTIRDLRDLLTSAGIVP